MYEDNQRLGNGYGAGVCASITGGGIGGNFDSCGDGDSNYGNGYGEGIGGWTDRDEQLSRERQGTNKK